jgi:predicted AAA+ superfamily ATPase
MTNEQTKKREIHALSEAMNELNLSSGIIVTRDEEDEIQIDNKKISVIPIWRYLLELE